jgi:sulfatase maturation enzyme AslB (radical SAM superfamily)
MEREKRKPLGRIRTPIASGAVLGNSLEEDREFPAVPEVLSLYPYSDDPDFTVREALKRDLSQVNRLRFDPVNVCNLRCIFCPQDLQRKHATISPESLRKVLEAIAPTCNRIIFGCAFEPTMAKNFTEYGRVIKEVVESKFVHKPVVNIITNGQLLDRHDLTPFTSFLSWIHISIHSHIKEKFEYLEGEDHAKFEKVRDNILSIRERHPGVRVHLEHVVSNVNIADVLEFVRWGFGTMDVNTINLRRMDGEIPTKLKSPLAVNLARGSNIAPTDGEWEKMRKIVHAAFPAVDSEITTSPDITTDVVELTKDDIPSFV